MIISGTLKTHEVEAKDKTTSTKEHGTFMTENFILMVFLVWVLGIGSVGAKWQNNHLKKSSLWHIWRSVPCSAQRSQQIFLKPLTPYHSSTHAKGSGRKRRDFPISPWGYMLLPPPSVPIFPPCPQKWGELGMRQSWRVMWMTLGVCWGHQHNLLAVASVPWLGMAVITWEFKHSARPMGDSEEVDIPKITACTHKFWVVIIK